MSNPNWNKQTDISAQRPHAAAVPDNHHASARYFQRDAWDETFALGVEAMLAAVQRDAAS